MVMFDNIFDVGAYAGVSASVDADVVADVSLVVGRPA